MSETTVIPSVDPKQLEQAYLRCSKFFGVEPAGPKVDAGDVFFALKQVYPKLSNLDLVDLSKRLRLLAELVAELSDKEEKNCAIAKPPKVLPSGIYTLVSEATAFETSSGTSVTVFFSRSLLADALALLNAA
ncbi:MAG: hypothetical protein AAGL97_09795 [Pseudomonadota bacterium]